MGDLERPQTAQTAPALEVVTPVMTEVKPVNTTIVQATAATQTLSYTEKTVTATTSNSGLLQLLDTQSQEMVQEIKEQLNLSSELEALRMLVKLGYNKAQGLTK